MTYPAGSPSSTRAITTSTTNTFFYTFRADDAAWVKVIVNGSSVELGFSVVPNPDGIGGSVVFVAAQPAGTEVIMLREVPIEQELDLIAKTRFSPSAIEGALDKLTMMLASNAQGIDDSLSRVNASGNEMQVDIDMDEHQIKNLLPAVDPNDAVTLQQLQQLLAVIQGGSKRLLIYTVSTGTNNFPAPDIGSTTPSDYLVFVGNVYQPPSEYVVTGGSIILSSTVPEGVGVSVSGYKMNVAIVDGEISIPKDIDFVILDSGQRDVTFNAKVSNSAFRLSGVDVDNGDLFETDDYIVTSDNSIWLRNSYPKGTRVTMAVPVSKAALANKRLPEPESERMVIAHRGFADLAPENTLAAISQAYSLGADGVEFDVMCTSDNVPVLMHDETVDRTTNGTGNLNSKTLAEVQQLDAGSWFSPVFNRCKVPTLEDTLRYCRGRFKRIHLEIKGYQWSRAEVETVTNMVKQLGVQGVVIYISYNRKALDWVREFDSTAAIGYIDATRDEVANMATNLGGELYCSFSGLSGDPTFPEYARSLGVNVFAKVFNSMKQHEQMAIEYGLTTIHSDNACGATRRFNSGSPCPMNSDYSNATKDEVAGGVVTVEGSDPSDRKLVVSSNTGGRAAIEFGMFYDRLGEITVGFFASLRSYNDGTFGVFQDNSPYLYDNSLEVQSEDVIYYETTFRTYLNSSRSDSEVDSRPLIIGGGAAADGECEFFRFRILNDSKYSATSGIAKGTIRSDNGVYSIHRPRSSYGILSIIPDGSDPSELNVRLDVGVDDSLYSMVPNVQVRGSSYSATHYAKVRSFFQDIMNVKVYRYDGASVDVTTLDGLFIDVLVS